MRRELIERLNGNPFSLVEFDLVAHDHNVTADFTFVRIHKPLNEDSFLSGTLDTASVDHKCFGVH